jgi:hypothetical protein
MQRKGIPILVCVWSSRSPFTERHRPGLFGIKKSIDTVPQTEKTLATTHCIPHEYFPNTRPYFAGARSLALFRFLSVEPSGTDRCVTHRHWSTLCPFFSRRVQKQTPSSREYGDPKIFHRSPPPREGSLSNLTRAFHTKVVNSNQE